jgi:hypothetical protein
VRDWDSQGESVEERIEVKKASKLYLFTPKLYYTSASSLNTFSSSDFALKNFWNIASNEYP